jgi:hypothetical protein
MFPVCGSGVERNLRPAVPEKIVVFLGEIEGFQGLEETLRSYDSGKRSRVSRTCEERAVAQPRVLPWAELFEAFGLTG